MWTEVCMQAEGASHNDSGTIPFMLQQLTIRIFSDDDMKFILKFFKLAGELHTIQKGDAGLSCFPLGYVQVITLNFCGSIAAPSQVLDK
jgi:hypothetical protein